MRRMIVVVSVAAFVLSVYLANWLVGHVGPIRVWPTSFLAPAGVYVVGLAFLLRDTVQRLGSRRLALLAIAAGTGLSVLVSPRLALASGAAFAVSECVGLLVFWMAQRRLWLALGASQTIAAALDSYVFLAIAFGSLAFFEGQFFAKLTTVALAAPIVVAARHRVPA